MSNYMIKGYRYFLAATLFICGIKAQQIGLVEYLSDPFEQEYVLELVKQHLFLVGSSMFFATLLGLAAGILLTRTRFRQFSPTVMYVISLGQTIPSLAVIALAMSVLGIGTRPAIFALLIYSVLPIARNTMAGINAVSPGIIDVINVGTAPLGFLVGAGGLGDLIFTGIDMMEPTKLLAGAIPTTLLALAGDYICELLGLLLIPRGLRLQKS